MIPGIVIDTNTFTKALRPGLRLYGSVSGSVGLIAQSAAGSVDYVLPNTDGSVGQALGTDGSHNLEWLSVALNTGQVTNGINYFNGTKVTSDAYFQYDGSTVRMSVIDSYGGLHILGRSGGEASLALQPDSVGDGSAGQWILYTNGSNLHNQNDFAFYSSELGRSVFILQSATGNLGVNNNNPQYAIDVTGAVNASGNVTGTNLQGNNTGDQDLSNLALKTTTLTWTAVTSSTSMAVAHGYIANNASAVLLTLPVTSVVGDILAIVGMGVGGWQIVQNSGQAIHFGSQQSTPGISGFLASQNAFDAVELLCITANTNWVVRSAQGNITVS